MSANTQPIYIKTPKNAKARLTTANVSSDGDGAIGTTLMLLVTAGADGSLISDVTVMPVASAAAASPSATVVRLFVSDVGSGNPTNANCVCIGEVQIPAMAAAVTSTTQVSPFKIPLPNNGAYLLQAGKFLLCSTQVVAAASTAWAVSCSYGDY